MKDITTAANIAVPPYSWNCYYSAVAAAADRLYSNFFPLLVSLLFFLCQVVLIGMSKRMDVCNLSC